MLSFLVCVVAITADSDIDVDLVLKQHQQVTQIILSSLQMQSPQSGVRNFDFSNQALQSCFDRAEEKQTEDLASYRDDLKACRRAASNSMEVLSGQIYDKRNSLVKRGNKACGRLSECERVNAGLQFFSCYSVAADWSSRDLRNISLVSDDEFVSLNMLNEQIVNDQKACGRTAKNSYEIASEKTKSEMRSCIQENFVPPSGIGFDPSTKATTVQSVSSTAYTTEDIDNTYLAITHPNRWERMRN